MIADIQDPTRGTSLPGTVYLPGVTKSDLPRVAHEVFHQIQYLSIPNVLGTLISEQKKASLAGTDVYGYEKYTFQRLEEIPFIEARANYVEDFARNYQYDKQKGNKFSVITKNMAQVLFLSGINSQAVQEVL